MKYTPEFNELNLKEIKNLYFKSLFVAFLTVSLTK
jgi:hypothetical protein